MKAARARRAPPNIDEVGNLVLLRQALDVLQADEATQRGLYPDDRDPAIEMAALFRDAWQRVAPVFTPLLDRRLVDALAGIEHALDAEPVDWPRVRDGARRARDVYPLAGAPSPRAWPEQIVRARGRLLLRRQLAEHGGRLG